MTVKWNKMSQQMMFKQQQEFKVLNNGSNKVLTKNLIRKMRKELQTIDEDLEDLEEDNSVKRKDEILKILSSSCWNLDELTEIVRTGVYLMAFDQMKAYNYSRGTGNYFFLIL